MQKANKRSRTAFTLIEMIAVMVLLGLISTIGMISVIGHFERAELGRVCQLLANADRIERDACRQSPYPGSMTLDASKRRMLFKNSGRIVDIGRSLKIAELVIVGPHPVDKSVWYAQSGQSPTYAVRLESRRGASAWVVLVGLSGQAIFSDRTDDVRALLAMGR